MISKASLALFGAATLMSAGLAHAVPGQITFQIAKGSHVDRQGLGVAHPTIGKRTRVLSFDVRFPASAAYRTKSPSNQSDACKLLGFTTIDIHGTSLRLGWAYNPSTNKMTLRLYAYVKGRRLNEPVTEVALDSWSSVQLRLGNDGVSATVNGITVSRPDSPGFGALSPTMMLKTAYFGGDETAPQDITVYVRNIVAN